MPRTVTQRGRQWPFSSSLSSCLLQVAELGESILDDANVFNATGLNECHWKYEFFGPDRETSEIIRKTLEKRLHPP